MDKSIKKSKTYMRIRIAVLLASFAYAILVTVYAWSSQFIRDEDRVTAQNGVFDLAGYDGTEACYLVNGWEYYPGQWIASEGVDQNENESPTYSDYVDITNGIAKEGENIRASQKASFRAHIINIPMETGFYLSGDVHGYTIFVNGKPVHMEEQEVYLDAEVLFLEPGQDYDIIIEDRGAIPSESLRAQTFSTQSYSNNIKILRIVVGITLIISIFCIACTVILLILSPSAERKGRLVVLFLSICALLWFACSSTKYTNTFRLLFPQMQDPQIVTMLNYSVAACLVLDVFCLLYYSVDNRKARNICSAGVAALLAGAIILRNTGNQQFQNLFLVISLMISFCALCLIIYRLLHGRHEHYFLLFAISQLRFSIAFSLFFPAPVMALSYMFILSGFFVVFQALLIVSIILRNLKMRRELEQLAKAQEVLLHTQGAFWASQIQPHFIYNTLQAIQGLCLMDPEQASELVGKFSTHLRRSTDYINTTEMIPFTEELQHVNNYVEIQKVRFQDSLTYIQHIEVEDFMIPPLSVQPLVENAIRYGVRSSEEGGTVVLETKREADGIHVNIKDDGPGFNLSEIKSNGGIENVRNRLKAFAHAELIFQVDSGIIAEIFIPLEEVAQP